MLAVLCRPSVSDSGSSAVVPLLSMLNDGSLMAIQVFGPLSSVSADPSKGVNWT